MTAFAVVGLGVGPASGDPGDPANSSDAMKQYQELSQRSAKVNEDFLKAKEDLHNKQDELARAEGAIAQAHAAEGQAIAAQDSIRAEADAFTAASFKGAQFDPVTAVLSSRGANDYLDRATALDALASHRKAVLDQYAAAINEARQARGQAEVEQRRAKEASDASAKLAGDAEQTKRDLDGQISKVRDAMGRLSQAEKNKLKDPGDLGRFIGVGSADAVIQTALAQRGKPYVWGASGPSAFDCSGLTLFAYKQAGMSLPHSARSQYDMGTSVGKGAWQPGDLLFWGSSASSIHHVGLYVGNGKIVHAATEGEPVKVVDVENAGSDYFGAKRLLKG